MKSGITKSMDIELRKFLCLAEESMFFVKYKSILLEFLNILSLEIIEIYKAISVKYYLHSGLRIFLSFL